VNTDLLNLIRALFPGLVSLLVIRSMVRPQRDLDDRPVGTVTAALALCFVNQALVSLLPRRGPEDLWRLALAVLLGLAMGWVIGKDWHYAAMRKLRLVKTTRYVHPWDRAFDRIEDWVVVHLEDGRRLRGWPNMWSDFGENCSLFLTRATWLDEDNKEIEVGGKGMLVLPTPTSKITFVQFLDRPKGEEEDNAEEPKEGDE
jgi:hypothetical protein